MNWFNRKQKNINTPTSQKKELPDGMWYKTPGGSIVHIRELKNNSYVCPEDDHHVRIGSKEYFEILFDNKSFKELDENLSSSDPLKFTDTKSYKDRVVKSTKATGLADAIRTAHGKLNGHKIVISCMDFSFIGGSMGSVVGEKISNVLFLTDINYLYLFMLIIPGGILMMYLWGKALQMISPTQASITLGFNPISATILGHFILNEIISSRIFVAIGLIIIAIFVSNWK